MALGRKVAELDILVEAQTAGAEAKIGALSTALTGKFTRSTATSNAAMRMMEKSLADTSKQFGVLDVSVSKSGQDFDPFVRSLTDAEKAGRDAGLAIEKSARLIGDAGRVLGDFSTSTDNSTRHTGLFASAIGALPSLLTSGVSGLSSMVGLLPVFGQALSAPLSGLSAMGGLMGSLPPLLAVATTGIGALAIALLAYPVIMAAATFAIHLLLFPLVTLAAVLVAATGPLSIFAAVLGGVGIGAVLGFTHALQSSGPWAAAFRTEIGKLKDGFGFLTKTLAHDFMPWFLNLGKVANNVLGYFVHLANVAGKGGLAAVFKSLSGGGLARLNNDLLKVVGPIGDVIQKTVAFAFGTGGAEGFAVIKADFSRFGDWWSKTAGPIIAWFNRQHFEKTGARWLNELLNALSNSAAWNRIWAFIKLDAEMAGSAAGKAFADAFVAELAALPAAILSNTGSGAGPGFGGARGGVRQPFGGSTRAPASPAPRNPAPGGLGGPRGGVNVTVNNNSNTAMNGQDVGRAVSWELRKAGLVA